MMLLLFGKASVTLWEWSNRYLIKRISIPGNSTAKNFRDRYSTRVHISTKALIII